MFKIERNIPVPTGYKNKPAYPLADMKVGDSFLDAEGKTPTVRARINNFLRTKEGKDKDFAARTVEGGVRVWRIK